MELKQWLGETNELGKDIFQGKYQNNDEIFEAWLDRICNGDRELRRLIKEKKFLLGGRALSNRGLDNGSYFNCYSSGYCPDDFKGIMDLNTNLGLTYKAQGGQGVSLSKLRPKGTPIGKRYTSDGILPFLELFNKTTEITSQAGSRKGALLVSLDIRHKEAEDFIKIKSAENSISKANLSLEIDDKFMKCVETYYQTGEEITLHEYREYTGHIVEYDIIPIKLYKLMMECAYDWAEPGCIFSDPFRNFNLMELDDDYQVETCNPCLHPDTLIQTVEGFIKIKDMNKSMKVYSMDINANKLVIKQASPSFISKKNADILNITLSNNNILKVTPNHNIYIKDRGWIEAKDLNIGDIPIALLRRRRGACYSGIRLSSQDVSEEMMEHRLIYEGINGLIPEGYDIHHIDGDSYNNDYSNLELLTHSDHAKKTMEESDNNHQVQDPDTGRFITHENSNLGKKTIVPFPEDLKANFNTTPRITDISKGESVDVYDITVEDTHNFIADGIVVHNCGEQPLAKNFCCNLGSINLSEFVLDEYTDKAIIDYVAFKQAIQIAVNALDVLVDENLPNHPLQEQRDNSANYRNIGLGLMGIGTALFKLKIKYGSEESKEFVNNLFHFMFQQAILASSKLAFDKGAFPKYKECVLDSQIIKNHFTESERAQLKEFGLRNCSLLSIAPTGSIGTMIGVTGGCEPEFAIKYTRKTDNLKESYDVYSNEARYYMEKFNTTILPDYFVCSADIAWKDRIDMQAVMQQHIDTAISSTVNLPNTTTLEEVEQLYLYAWKMKLKGITIYRDGCSRSGVLINEKTKTIAEPTVHIQNYDHIQPVSRSSIGKTYGTTDKLITACGSLYLTINRDKDSNIVETFASTSKNGTCKSNIDGMNRMISLALRSGVSVKEIIDQLKGINCAACTRVRAKGEKVISGLSCPDMIAKALESEYSDNSIKIMTASSSPTPSVTNNGNICPECHTSLENSGGCVQCLGCGWSKCS